MRVVSEDGDVVEGEVVDRVDAGVEDQPGEWAGLATQLEPCLLQMVQIEVSVTEGVDEVTDFQAANLSNHLGQQCVGGNVEGNAEKDVRRTLIELAGQSALGNLELKHRMAGRQRHVSEITNIPRADNVPA